MADNDLVGLVQGQEQIRRVASTYAGFTDEPGLAVSLAQSGATAEQIRAVGGFLKGLQLSTKVVLARQSGVKLDLNDDDRAVLTSVGSPYADVDRVAQEAQLAPPARGRGFLGTLGHYANNAMQLPGIKQTFSALNRAADVTNTLYRESAPFFGGTTSPESLGADIAERGRGMRAGGYDSGSILSTLAFASRGKQVYHNMDDLRQAYSPEQVALAQTYLLNPEDFTPSSLPDDELAKRQLLLQDQKFQNLVTEVDSRHKSPGRDLAGAIFDPGSKKYTATSGTFDAVWSFMADPTIILGKAAAAGKAVRYGISDLSDTTRIRGLMEGNASVKRGWTALLDDARIMRSGDAAEAAGAYARVRVRTPELVPMLDEINGGGLRSGVPVESYDDLVEHVVGTGALMRMRNGLTAADSPLMPGALSRTGFRQVKASLAARSTEKGVREIDLEKHADSIVQSEVDGVNGLGADATGLDAAVTASADSEAVGAAALAYRRSVKGRARTLATRMTTLLPEHRKIDLTGASGAEDVRRFAALYMPRSHANMLAARYAVAPVGERRAIAEAMYDQTIHAAGVTRSTSGRAWYQDQLQQRAVLDNSAYDASGTDLDRLVGNAGEPARRAALYEGQTSTDFWLPDFAELRRFSAKVSIYDFTVRSGLESRQLDRALGALRTSWLLSPASAVRNAVENVVSAHFRGASVDEIARSRAALSSGVARRVADRAVELSQREVDPQYRAMKGTLRGVYHGRVLSGMRRAESATGAKVSGDKLALRASELVDDEMAGDLDELLAITGLATRGGASAVEDAMMTLDRGYKVTPVSFKNAGYQLDSADGMGGARYWAQQLGMRFAGTEGDYVLKAALDENGVVKPTGEQIRKWAIAQDPEMATKTTAKNGTVRYARRLTPAWEKRYHGANPPTTMRQLLVEHLLSDDYKIARAKLERFHTLRDGTLVGDDPALIRRAAEELAADQIVDMRALVTGRDGKVVKALTDELQATKRAPSVKFLQDIADESRPAQVIQPKFVADLDAQGSVAGNVVNALADKAYHVAVARPLAWMSTLPIYHSNYVKAYDRVETFLKANHPEWTPDELAPHIRDVARQHAMDLTVQMIDNPRVRSQMALITRNVFNFWRAQEDFMRRWGRNLKENPAALRELQLAVEGGMHTGIVHQDDQGNLVFSYPGSGLAIQGVGKALGAFGLGEYVGLGVTPNMTTKLQFLNAGLDRPFLPTTSPVASIPLRVLKHFSGDQVALIQAQEIAEGEISSGRSWWQQFLPAPVYRFTAAHTADEREGQYASATRNAAINLYAAGLAPDATATPDEIDAFKKRIQTGVRNQLTARAVLALILPGAPSAPTEETDASKAGKLEKAAYNSVTLKDEFRQWVGKYGYQRALALWTESHPDDLVYTVSTTEGAGGTGGYLGPTEEVLGWLKANPELATQYPALAAYFAPDGPGDFSSDAWRTELELGLRQHKDLGTFYRDVAVKNAESTYYKTRDKKNLLVANATAAGDDDEAKRIKESFATWMDTYKAANPLLLEKWQQSDQNKTRIAALVSEVDKLSTSPLAETIDPHGDLARISQAFASKKQWDDTHPSRTADARAQNDSVNTSYMQYIAGLLTRSPHLIPVYQGVFDRVE